MNDYELLDMIGDVSEDYVLAADSCAARPRFHWKALAACAACAVLLAASYPAFHPLQAQNAAFSSEEAEADEALAPEELRSPALHSYTVVGGGGAELTAQAQIKDSAGGANEPVSEPIPGGASVGGDSGAPYEESGQFAIGSDADGTYYEEPWQDAPAQEEAIAQYDRLLQNMDVGTPEQRLLLAAAGEPGEPEDWPEWFAGAWLDNDWPDNVARLTVAIADGFRTPELEAQIVDWCGGTGDVLFCGAKYSQSYLASLVDPVVEAMQGTGLPSGIGVHQMENCLSVHVYSMSDVSVPDSVLAELARLDPDGDAIQVQVFVGSLDLMDDVVK